MAVVTIFATELRDGPQGFPSVSYELRTGDSGSVFCDANRAIETLQAHGFTGNQARRALHDARDAAADLQSITIDTSYDPFAKGSPQ